MSVSLNIKRLVQLLTHDHITIPGAPESNSGFSGMCVEKCVFCSVLWINICLIVIFLSVIVFTSSDYPLGIFNVFIRQETNKIIHL